MAVQPDLCQTWSETPQTGFHMTGLKCLSAGKERKEEQQTKKEGPSERKTKGKTRTHHK